MLSLVAVLGVFVILGVRPVSPRSRRARLTLFPGCFLYPPSQIPWAQNRRSSDKKHFVRTHVAIYFLSLLLCNLAQAIGALFNIAWIVKMRVDVGTMCTAQAVIKQLSSVRDFVYLRITPNVDTSHVLRLG